MKTVKYRNLSADSEEDVIFLFPSNSNKDEDDNAEIAVDAFRSISALNPETIIRKGHKLSSRYLQFLLIILLSIVVLVCFIYFIQFLHFRLNDPIDKFHIRHEILYSKTIPGISTESAIRLVDVNDDGVEDYIIGFGTNLDALVSLQIECLIYFPEIVQQQIDEKTEDKRLNCGGGILAINGQTGEILWKKYSHSHEIYSLNCQVDLDGDEIKDCLAAGRGGTFEAISGRNGKKIWFFDSSKRDHIMNLYTPQYIIDIDNDEVPDIVQIHGGDPIRHPDQKEKRRGIILIFSGRTGEIISSKFVPGPVAKESYYSPVIYSKFSKITNSKQFFGTADDYLLIGTGGETHGGALWIIPLSIWFQSNRFESETDLVENAVELWSDNKKGIMTPPIIVDINGDGYNDIIFTTFNGTTVALDGEKNVRKILWKYEKKSAESYSTPSIGYWKNGELSILVHNQIGSGYPFYSSSVTDVIDGKSGKLIKNLLIDHLGAQSSPLTITSQMNGKRSDFFLFWQLDCQIDNESNKKFSVIGNVTTHEAIRTDFCRNRFNSTGFSRYLLRNNYMSKNYAIYDSSKNVKREHSIVMDSEKATKKFLKRFPQFQESYNKFIENRWTMTDLQQLYSEEDDLLYQNRKKRHVGNHDDGGVQRIISTGTIVANKSNSRFVDVLFATYWFYPSSVQLMTETDLNCIEQYKKKESLLRLSNKMNDEFENFDHDAFMHKITQICLTNRGMSKEEIHKLFHSSNIPLRSPYNRQMGSLTFYKIRVEIKCKSQKFCPEFLSSEKQMWSEYMGKFGNSYANLV
ncbi:hypothetical protein SNEBB_011435 [Seison nebaliae]|nr:hypothetical protein SNEBB_011435 [Seison nebaliae]